MYAKLFSGDIMNELFIKQMQELLKDEFNDFAKALMQKQVKALYLNKTKENVDTYSCFWILNDCIKICSSRRNG